MKLITYNVQNDMKKPSTKKIESIVSFIQNEDPDIVGFQELTFALKQELQKLLPRYKFLGRSRFGMGFVFDEFNCLLVRKSLQVFETNTYSLGRNPDKVRSKNILSPFPRIFTSAVVPLDGIKVKILNTHLDNLLKINKKYQLRVIEEILENNDYPLVIMGDLNMHPGNENLIKFINDLNLINEGKEIGRTSATSEKDRPIDYILTSTNIEVKNLKKDISQTVSDHYPVICEINIKKSQND